MVHFVNPKEIDTTNPGPRYPVLPKPPLEQKGLNQKEILKIASDPETSPNGFWQLKDDVKAGDVQKQILAFAKAIIQASGGTFKE